MPRTQHINETFQKADVRKALMKTCSINRKYRRRLANKCWQHIMEIVGNLEFMSVAEIRIISKGCFKAYGEYRDLNCIQARLWFNMSRYLSMYADAKMFYITEIGANTNAK